MTRLLVVVALLIAFVVYSTALINYGARHHERQVPRYGDQRR